MTLKTVFEKETCGRCGGSGRYSYNQMHGSTCYGCAGSGERLTKRGRVARAFYIASCSIKLADVVAGDVIDFGGVTVGGSPYSRKGTVEKVEATEQKFKSGPACNDPDAPWQTFHQLSAKRVGGSEWSVGRADTMVRKYWPTEVNAAKVAAALAYQETLTQAGKPRKVPA